MAVTAPEVESQYGAARGNVRVWDITFSADADTTTGDIAHGFGAVPEEVILTPRNAACAIALARVDVLTASVWRLTKSTTAGSGGANYVLVVKRPSIETR
jgi:hypothetical protein